LARLQEVISDLEGFAGKQVALLAAVTARTIIARTPIDTRWAQSNWLVSIAVPRTETIGSKERVDFGPQKASIASLGLYRWPLPIFISNNVPYINSLNNGTSGQAPRGFVQTAIAQSIVRARR
jgi:hypothetical protein